MVIAEFPYILLLEEAMELFNIFVPEVFWGPMPKIMHNQLRVFESWIVSRKEAGRIFL